MFAKLTAFARPIVGLAALALIAVLFLPWREAPVHTQWLNDSGAASGLDGWGALAGGLVLVVLLAQFLTSRRARVIAGMLAVAAAGATYVGFFTGSADPISSIGVVTNSTEVILWPAYAGLVLAVALAAAAVARAMQPPEQRLALPPMVARIPAPSKAAAGWWG